VLFEFDPVKDAKNRANHDVTYRGAVTRVISLRKANPREERWYAQATRE